MRSNIIKVDKQDSQGVSASDYQNEIKRLEQRLQSLIEISSDFYWELDGEHRLTTVRGPDVEKGGFDAQQLIGKRHWELVSVVPVSDDGRWDNLVADMDAHKPFNDFIYKYLTLNGEQRYVKISGQPIFDESGTFIGYRGITKDVTHAARIERRVAVEQAVTRVLADSSDAAAAIGRLLGAICETLGWACGAYWRVDHGTQSLDCGDVWGVPAAEIDAFLKATKSLSPLKAGNLGLVRRTFSSGAPQWIRNVSKEPTFQRADSAAAARLRSAFAFPIKTGGKTIGVMEFYCRDAGHQADDDLLRGAAQLGESIGQFFQRKHAEEELLRFRAAMDTSGDAIYLVDRATMRFVDVNQEASRRMRYSRDELLKMGPHDLLLANRDEIARSYDEVIAAGDAGITTQIRARSKEGRVSVAELHRRALRIGGKWFIVSIARDVTQRKRAEEATIRLSRMFAALSATNEAIMHATSPRELYQKVCDAAVNGGRFLTAAILIPDQTAGRMEASAVAGANAEQLFAMPIPLGAATAAGDDIVCSAFKTKAPSISIEALKDSVPRRTYGGAPELKSRAAIPLLRGRNAIGVLLLHAGEKRAFDDEIVKLLERMAENIAFALDNFEREAERKRGQERIQYLATHDGLTELPNRVMFNELLSLAIQSARRYERKFAVLFVDLDRFKIINDTLGHQAGDALLKEMSVRLKDCLRASDVVARLGGDEFVVLVQEAHEADQVATVARKILSAAMAPMEILGQECRVTASIGIAMYPADAEDEQALMKSADIAMYLAKEEGKNNFQFYSKEIKAQSLERMALETHLRRALERNEFSLNYQAKLDLKSGEITGVEALLRWNNLELGSVSPMHFIPVAEETGLIIPIGRWVLKTACEQNVAWQRQGLRPLCMAVNLSPRQFADPDLLKDVGAILAETGMAPGMLELEITESMVMHNTERAVTLLSAIKEMGVRLAIDDFGTGYSSLAQLKRFPIDTLKVDRSFIREIPKDTEDRAITEAIIAMGRSLSLTIVAEGVETQEQQAFLREHACDEMQGYYFSRPIEAEQFAELLRNHTPAITFPIAR